MMMTTGDLSEYDHQPNPFSLYTNFPASWRHLEHHKVTFFRPFFRSLNLWSSSSTFHLFVYLFGYFRRERFARWASLNGRRKLSVGKSRWTSWLRFFCFYRADEKGDEINGICLIFLWHCEDDDYLWKIVFIFDIIVRCVYHV